MQCTCKYKKGKFVFLDGYQNLMWSEATTSQTDSWRYANVMVGSSSDFSLVFEAELGAGSGLLAIDDVTLTPECLVGGESSGCILVPMV